MKSLLNKKRSKTSVNRDEYMSVELTNQMKKFGGNTQEHLVDLYQVYLDEKDASDKYRLIFTVNPVCSNVLFNAITEIVYKEGSNECACLTDENLYGEGEEPNRLEHPYIISDEGLTRMQAIRDTEYSNEKIFGLDYLPGIDIFNNHLLRQNGFNCVLKRDNSDAGGEKTGVGYNLKFDSASKKYYFTTGETYTDVFNTIRDYQRTTAGKKLVKKFPGHDATYLQPITGQPHIYEESEILDFESAFMERLSENNGWFGFYNPSTLDIPVAEDEEGGDIYINKLLNNKNACDFIDMFPDRKRFTFVPQKNMYRGNRLEKNWEYCLTYPYKSTECLLDEDGNAAVDESGTTVLIPIVAERDSDGYVRNGLKFSVVGTYYTDSDRMRVLIQSTGSIHNLSGNSTVNLYYFANSEGMFDSAGTFSGVSDIAVKGLGNRKGELMQYFFSIDASDVPGWFDEEGKLLEGITGRFCKVVFGIECEYYFRVFRRLPNFKSISQDEERAYYAGKYNAEEYDFNSEINKLAFANNIYGDNIVQIVYLDDIDVNGLTDNLERPLSDIYLTIVKSNKGHELWYPESGDPVYHETEEEEMTLSRCFGKVTSGIDLPSWPGFTYDYNVHRLHNIKFADLFTTYEDDDQGQYEFNVPYENVGLENYNYLDSGATSGYSDDKRELLKCLEDDIKISQEFFLGDLVEFSVSQYQETILEPVYHRFNTAQREYVSNAYKNIIIDEIYMDDYEGSETGATQNTGETIEGNFKCVIDTYNKGYEENPDESLNQKVLITYPGNLFPEGYFYQPHYRIHLKDISEKLSQSSDTLMYTDENGVVTGSTGDYVTFTTLLDYDLTKNDGIVIQDSKNNIFYDAIVTEVEDVKNITAYTINGDKINDPDRVDSSMTPSKFLVFKKTLGIPKYAIHYPDTSGKYIWRPLVAHSKTRTDSEIYDKPFANGAHYRHVGINFFLRRQDPYGDYKLNMKNENATGEVNKLTNFMVSGRFNESIYYNDAIDLGLIDIC